MNPVIRHAVEADIEALANIYNHYVTATAFTFDLEPKSIEERLEWFAHFSLVGKNQLLVAVKDEVVIGYAGTGKFREKTAYGTSVEASIYLDPDLRRQGAGSLLYDALFDSLASVDIHRAYAGITLPNDASIALHRKFGFHPAGLYREVGRKFGRYWDVQWFEKDLN